MFPMDLTYFDRDRCRHVLGIAFFSILEAAFVVAPGGGGHIKNGFVLGHWLRRRAHGDCSAWVHNVCLFHSLYFVCAAPFLLRVALQVL